MHPINRILILLTISFIAQSQASPRRVANSICNPNEIGIGVSEVFNYLSEGNTFYGVSGEGSHGTVYAHNCHIVALSDDSDLWHGGWHAGYGVSSTDYGQGLFPTEVRTPDGVYNDCIALVERNCNVWGATYYLSGKVTHCCKYSGPNKIGLTWKGGNEKEVGDGENIF